MGMEGAVEMYKYLPGYEAWKVKSYNTLRDALVGSHGKVLGKLPEKAPTYMVSMWRDINPYNELGVPVLKQKSRKK